MSVSRLIVSGKGGVGKSTVTAALGIALSQLGNSVCCVDNDIGLRSLDMFYGLENQVIYDTKDVIDEKKDMETILEAALLSPRLFPNLKLLSASQFSQDDWLDAKDLERLLTALKRQYSDILLDAPAGLGKNVRNLMEAADEIILVCTPDDLCLRDAEQVIAMLDRMGKPRPQLLVNKADAKLIFHGEMYSPQTMAEVLDVPLLGFLPEDKQVPAAIRRHESFMLVDCPAVDAAERIARRLLGEDIPVAHFRTGKSLFRRKPKRIFKED